MDRFMGDRLSRDWDDISSEMFREYVFGDGCVRIDAPALLHVSASGGHRVLDHAGVSYYIPARWYAVRWVAKEGEPNFVK